MPINQRTITGLPTIDDMNEGKAIDRAMRVASVPPEERRSGMSGAWKRGACA